MPTIPTIHLNGTPRSALVAAIVAASAALQEARHALGETCPNGRDYYPQGPEAIKAAMAEHEARMVAITAVRDEILRIGEAVI